MVRGLEEENKSFHSLVSQYLCTDSSFRSKLSAGLVMTRHSCRFPDSKAQMLCPSPSGKETVLRSGNSLTLTAISYHTHTLLPNGRRNSEETGRKFAPSGTNGTLVRFPINRCVSNRSLYAHAVLSDTNSSEKQSTRLCGST